MSCLSVCLSVALVYIVKMTKRIPSNFLTVNSWFLYQAR